MNTLFESWLLLRLLLSNLNFYFNFYKCQRTVWKCGTNGNSNCLMSTVIGIQLGLVDYKKWFSVSWVPCVPHSVAKTALSENESTYTVIIFSLYKMFFPPSRGQNSQILLNIRASHYYPRWKIIYPLCSVQFSWPTDFDKQVFCFH